MVVNVTREVLGIYAERGFDLSEPDDHFLVLSHQGAEVVRFLQSGATQESIQAECARHLALRHGWDGCLYQAKK